MITRREFLKTAALAGPASVLGTHPRPVSAEPPPETTTIRLTQSPIICVAPQYLAEALLRAEGFAEVRYVKNVPGGASRALASGEADVSMAFAPPLIIHVDGGAPIVLLAGVHAGCWELFGTNDVRTIRDLKKRRIAVPELGSAHHAFLASMGAYVGLDPRTDLNFITHPPAEAMRLFVEGKIDAYLSFPPDSQELRVRKIGYVVVNSAVDRPWSQYFCCIVAGNREFVRKNPVATKRAVRAILKGADVCALEPDRVARFMMDRGYATRFDYAVQLIKELPYAKWREYDPEDTVRFYALRLHEAGMIKSSPQKIIAQGTDWRFLNELKKELKG